jgi:hypothetical protein
MKNILVLLVSVLLLAACSAPKYSYHFDHYDYNSGKKKNVEAVKTELADNAVNQDVTVPVEVEQSPLQLEKETMVASSERVATRANAPASTVEKADLAKAYKEMSKSERKEFKKTLKAELKNYIKGKKSGDNGGSVADTKVMDYNLKMAIIFAAVAVTLSFFGGVNTVFWILSVVALVVAVVFFIKWIAEQ